MIIPLIILGSLLLFFLLMMVLALLSGETKWTGSHGVVGMLVLFGAGGSLYFGINGFPNFAQTVEESPEVENEQAEIEKEKERKELIANLRTLLDDGIELPALYTSITKTEFENHTIPQGGSRIYRKPDLKFVTRKTTRYFTLDYSVDGRKYQLRGAESAELLDKDEQFETTVVFLPGKPDSTFAGDKLEVAKELAVAMGKKSLVSECKVAELMLDTPILLPKANETAWKMATSETENQRSGEIALQLALILCRQTKNGNAEFLQTLAAAYAELGDFEMAIAAQNKAIGLLEDGDSADAQLARTRLEILNEQKPIREKAQE